MIKQTDIKQIVHRVLTAAEIHHNRQGVVTDLFCPEVFDRAVEQVRAALEDITFIQPMRKAVIEVGQDEEAAIELIAKVMDYLPDNYNAVLFETGFAGDNETGSYPEPYHSIEIYGYDDHGWTLDGYVIPRLASGLIVAEEVK